MTTLNLIATCPIGIEPLLADELRALGAADVRESRAAVAFSGTLETAYRACLWSRLASRILLTLATFPAMTAEELYDGVSTVAWEEHLSATLTIAVDAVGRTPGITHSGFAALKVKDAVVDQVRERTGERPSVDLEAPDVRLNLRLHKGAGSLSIDMSGEPLHRRGYRAPGEQAEAPLKESLAAAILVRAGWPAIAAAGGSLFDPMCGSGTLLLEGALMAADRAPGLLRQRWGFEGWLGHDPAVWERLIDEADTRAEAGADLLPLIGGSDSDPAAIELARGCIKRAGLGSAVRVDVRELAHARPAVDATPGLVVTNPPYGVRLGAGEDLAALYGRLGEQLVAAFDGWTAAVLTSESDLARATKLRSHKAYAFMNGAVETKLYLFEISPSVVRAEVRPAPLGLSAGAEMFTNRLRKNQRHLGKWARRENVTCWRVYGADLPEYAVAIDVYEGAGPDEGRRFAHIQEYAPPPHIDSGRAEERLAEIVAAAPEFLRVAPEDIALKVRRRQRGESQYERREDSLGTQVEVAEGGLRLLVNLHDYLDTGLFLDHRLTRDRIRNLALGRRFLNLFAYTGAASVYAADGGATSVTTVDMSSTYLNWARRNMALNGFAESNTVRFERVDVLAWLTDERKRVEVGHVQPYGLIFLDPPTFSNSKKMGERTFDVQRDHVALLRDATALLAPDGVLLFSNNYRKFKLAFEELPELDIQNISAATIPPDFERNPRIHVCYEVRRR
ncbi:MAG: bifunctional 23S rRNA (guanine(2069)-N(7))-methyltransferase RlmK/23S rRNA (guanine(2445)-N(2))-methyltransferase RlmL [Actinomycetota bacterium]|nr:bifunctional 23S rRNA (guanine(2069)-N(7))-methyltransferase RlmK/23S rRNA (guanine(2445)-N(2))-methyltransferase RlmL [Actinomycetota bacterium]